MNSQLGQEGFRWFLGIVQDLQDPMMLGRARIRIVNEHDDKVDTESLPWAHILMPNTSASLHGVGDTPNLMVGTNILGFFLDSNEKQIPMIIGTIPIIPGMDQEKHSLSILSREKQNIKKELIGPEPKSAYSAQYPFNRVISSKAGHIIEIDDTPEHERIHIYHISGSYIEMDNDGNLVIKSAKNSYDITKGDKEIYVKGNANIKVEGRCNIHATKAAAIESDEGLKLKSPGGVTVVGGSLTVEKSIAGGTGASGSFTSASGQKINVQNGLVTSIG